MNHWKSLFCIMILCFCTLPAQASNVTVKEIIEKEKQVEEKKEQLDHAAETPEADEAEATKEAKEPAPVPYTQRDEYSRDTPRGAMAGFLAAAIKHDYERATHYLDYRNIPPEAAQMGEQKLAEFLSLVINRTVWIDVQSLSKYPEGKNEERLPDYRDLVTELETSQGSVPILLQRVPNADRSARIWKISNATVSQIPFLVDEFGYSPVGEWLYKRLPNKAFLGIKLWQWVYYIGTFALCLGAAFIVTRILNVIAKKLKKDLSKEATRLITWPLCLLLAVFFSRAFSSDANSTLASRAVFEGATLLIIAWTWMVLHVVNVARYRLSKRFERQGNSQATFLLRPAGNVLKIIIVIVALLLWFENLGFDATTLLAGLGIGGLAVALAAQKTVENIIGALTLYISAPVKVGSFCRFGNNVGTIEEIGLRATRVRTVTRSVIHVANAKFVDMELENISQREMIAYTPELVLDRRTTKDQVAQFCERYSAMLKEHDELAAEPCRVRFSGFVPRGIKIETLSYVKTTNFDHYLEVTESINLEIVSLLAELNIELAPVEQH